MSAQHILQSPQTTEVAMHRSPFRPTGLLACAALATLLLLNVTVRTTTVTAGNWGLDAIDQRSGIDGNYSYTANGAGVNIYVIDTGVRRTHQDFGDRALWVGSFCDSDSPDTTASEWVTSDGYDGHGTHDASYAIGATYGVAKGATVRSLRAGGCNNNYLAMRRAVNWITSNGVKPAVVNISFNGGGDTTLQDAIRTSMGQGFVYVLSAGTATGSSSDIGGWGTLSNGIGSNQAIVVAGTDSNRNNFAGWDRGPLLSLWAPAKGLTGASYSSNSCYSVPELGGGCAPATNNAAGDSFAAPFVSGVAAIYLQRHKNATPATVKSALTAFATPGGASNVGTSTNRFLYSRVVNPIGDVNGDGQSDFGVFRPSTGGWHVMFSTSGTTGASSFSSSDLPAPGDYNGDGQSDFGVFQPSTGNWHVVLTNGSVTDTPWGQAGDIPVPGDYNGDGRADYAIFRPSTAGWHVLLSSGGQVGATWGLSTDVPVPGDYNADGKTDFAVFRPSTAAWFVLYSSGGQMGVVYWGVSTDTPTPGDYDGDGLSDFAVYRKSIGTWLVKLSSGGETSAVWGLSTDIPVAGDFNGDGRADYTIFRPSSAGWHVLFSSGGTTGVTWGQNLDIPVTMTPRPTNPAQ